jgi:O-antigen/teichoic acid export membrane protein
LTAGVTVVLARILTPADYGLFAIALAVQLVGQRAAELGLPSALIRLEEDPSRELQAAVSGAMIGISTLCAGLFFAAAFLIVPATGNGGRTLQVVAVATAAMPFYAARATPMLLMERHLKFGRVAAVETVDTLVFNAFALLAAVAGLGAFSLTSAVAVSAVAGLAAAWAVQPSARRPTLDLERIRPLVGFGLRVSVLQGVFLLKELGFVVLIAAIGGTATAGFYARAKRLFSFPIALSSAVVRVSFPALSKDQEQSPRRAARIAAMTALFAGLPLALVAGAAQPLVVVLLGANWLPTTDIVVWGSVGMLLTASVLPTMISYALTEGQPGAPIVSAIVETTLLCVLTAALIGPLDETAIGIAITAGAVGALTVLARTTHASVRGSLTPVGKATAISVAAIGAAQALGVSNDIAGLLVAAAAATGTWLALETIFARAELRELIGFVRPLLGRVGSA